MYVVFAEGPEDLSVGRSELIYMQLFDDVAPTKPSQEVEAGPIESYNLEKEVVLKDTSQNSGHFNTILIGLIIGVPILVVLLIGVGCWFMRRNNEERLD